MKKTLTTDIRRYDNKMKLKFDGKTFKAIGIALGAAVVPFIILFVLAGQVPATVISTVIFGVMIVLQLGTVQGISMAKYLLLSFKFMLFPSLRKKPYAREKNVEYSQITVLTEAEQKQERKG